MPALPHVALATLIIIGVVAGTGAARQASQAPVRAVRIPVLVELFTSEGCSSCPPADTLLRDLIATQPVEGVVIIGLSEHVDYWNRLGWTDPFSDRVFSARQSAYATFTRSDDVYTPQMVVDGRVSFVGSNRERALKEIATAATHAKAMIDLHWSENGDLDVRMAPGNAKPNSPVWVSIAEHGLTVRVAKGENAYRTLTHDAVTRRLSEAGRVDRSGAFHRLVPVDLAKAWRASETQVAVFVQEVGQPITALGTIRLSDRHTK